MTTTAVHQGLGEDAKPSSRVLAPPGGGSSNIFGAPEARTAPSKPYQRSDLLGGGKTEVSAPSPAQKPEEVRTQNRLFGQAAPKQTDAKPAQSKNSGAYNPITGEAYTLTANPDTGSSNHPSTRVRQPPGGASSGLW